MRRSNRRNARFLAAGAAGAVLGFLFAGSDTPLAVAVIACVAISTVAGAVLFRDGA